jgi:predicted glycoside hydrolase/deacetylase ChbG (UPF0249 family)
VNRGIVETIERGVVTSASLMINMPACDDAIRRLRELQARGVTASIGLHFNIVTGRALGTCPTLTQPRSGAREFLPLLSLAWRAFARRIDPRDVEAELEAQLQRAGELLATVGTRVTHIDSHRHAHCLPGVLDVVLRTARRHHIEHVRHPNEGSTLLRSPRASLAAQLLRVVLATQTVPPIDDIGFTGVGAMGSRTFDRDLLEIISALPQGTTELMVHPGYDSPELAALDPYRAPREREVRALTSPALRERIVERGVELTRFGATAAPA